MRTVSEVVREVPAGPGLRVLLAFPPVLAGALWLSLRAGRVPGWRWIAELGGGLVLWTLIEYVGHRFLFHLVPRAEWLLRRQQHLAHHQAPNDPAFFVIPLWLSLPLAALVAGILRLLTGAWAPAAAILSGVLAGYLAYELIHYAIHFGRGGGPLLRMWRRHHLYHHYRDDTRCYGFTTSLWDVMFGTARPRRQRRSRPVAGAV